jgi:hypothetical protein
LGNVTRKGGFGAMSSSPSGVRNLTCTIGRNKEHKLSPAASSNHYTTIVSDFSSTRFLETPQQLSEGDCYVTSSQTETNKTRMLKSNQTQQQFHNQYEQATLHALTSSDVYTM